MTQVPEQVKKELLEYPFVNAVGSGYGQGKRHKNGEKCAVAFVVEKKPESELDEEAALPKEINGWKVDVQEVETIGIEPIQPQKPQDTGEINTTDEHRPAPQGVSISHPDVTAGAQGFVAWEKAEKHGYTYAKPVGVSNNHVAANENDAAPGDNILQPGRFDGGNNTDKDRIGELEDFVELKDNDNKVDLAWYSVDGRKVNSYIPSIGVPTETAEVTEGDEVKKFGRTTGLEKAKVLSTDARVRVNYSSGVKEFEDQVIAESFSAGGDSGSAVVDSQGRLVGLLFAGSSRVTVFNKINHVLNKSGLALEPEKVYD
jgi:hypothetical protein